MVAHDLQSWSIKACNRGRPRLAVAPDPDHGIQSRSATACACTRSRLALAPDPDHGIQSRSAAACACTRSRLALAPDPAHGIQSRSATACACTRSRLALSPAHGASARNVSTSFSGTAAASRQKAISSSRAPRCFHARSSTVMLPVSRSSAAYRSANAGPSAIARA